MPPLAVAAVALVAEENRQAAAAVEEAMAELVLAPTAEIRYSTTAVPSFVARRREFRR